MATQRALAGQHFSARSYDLVEVGTAQNFIGGAWQDAASGQTLEVENPWHGKPMGRVVLSASADVQAAVEAAQKALPAWRAAPMKERSQVLYRMKALMEKDLDGLAYLVSHENGKDVAQSRASVLKGVECVEMGAALANAAQGEQLDVSRGVNCAVSYEPLGIVAGIVPFNFPAMVPMWMLPQALLGGNAFILKPSEQVPYTASRLAALFQEAGLPDGILNLIQGQRAAVEAVVDHPAVKAVGFVGSSAVARLLYVRGAELGKRMLCLGGAKNHLLVVPDADVELTADNVVASAFGSGGQRCMAAANLVAIGDVQHVIDAIVAKAKAWKLGEDMGPLISAAATKRIHGIVAAAEEAGARVLLDGRQVSVPAYPGGHWMGPTVLDQVTTTMSAGCDEIFGPVLSILRVATLDQALAIENANPYGNAAAIYTTSGAVARTCIDRFEAGMCGVNIGVPVPREPFAFGGWNMSKFGHGDITGMDGFRFWTRPRKVTSKWARQSDQTWMG